MEIDVYMDYVLVNSQRLDRPTRITRSRWMAYWEGAKRFGHTKIWQ